MIVIFTFICNGVTYRVRREYLKAYGKPLSQLDIAIVDPQTNTTESLTDKSIPLTQRKIETLIGLSYETFINSVFLRQGASNEFSKKSPKERKELLATILGLDQYEALRRFILEKARTVQTQLTHTQSLRDHLNTKLAMLDQLRIDLYRVKKTITEIEERIVRTQTTLKSTTQKLTELATQVQQQEILRIHEQTINEQEEKARTALRTTLQVWRTVHGQLLQVKHIDSLEKRRADMRALLEQHKRQQKEMLAIKENQIKLKELIQQRLSIMMHEHVQLHQAQAQQQTTYTRTQAALTHIQDHIGTLTKEVTQIDQTIARTEQATKELATYLNKREQIERQFEKRRMHYQRYIAEGNMRINELTELKHKKFMTHHALKPSCPLCEQYLPVAKKRFLQTKFTHQESFLKHRLDRLTALIAQLKALLITQHTELERYTKAHEQHSVHLHTLQTLRDQRLHITTALTTAHETAERLKVELKTLETMLTTSPHTMQSGYETTLSDDLILQDLQKQLTTVEKQLAQHQYNEQQHQEIITQLHELDVRIIQQTDALQEQRLQEKRKEEIHALCMSLKELKRTKHTLTLKLTEITQTTDHYAAAQQEVQILETDLHTYAQEHQTCLQQAARLEQHVSMLEQLDAERMALIGHITELEIEYAELTVIIQALSKDGIQALLIEQALPELEHEANALLARLTDNQTQLFFESLRDLKNGSTKETLDINIADVQGIRPYEMFSGGEAFRIDFALRIALSKLLARRAGATLQTLIIDEGFGSQDEEGLSHIIDALYAIQDDFAKIIIVSHLPTMKHAFPVQYIVHKSPHGSTISPIEQG